MNLHDVAFAIPAEVRPADVLNRLARDEETRRPADAALERTYLDTFDWRLYRAGLLLVEDRGSGRGTLRLATRNGVPPRTLRTRRPAFGADLPAGWLRDRVEPILGPRRLLPRVTVEGTARGLELIDDEEKTLARAVVEEGRALLSDGTVAELAPIVRVERLRGYHEHAARWVECLRGWDDLQGLEGGGLEHALRALGAWPGTNPSKPEVTLHPSTRADSALHALLAADLAVVEANEAGVLEDLDVEFLHDLRVACRRSRSLLGEMGDLLGEDAARATVDGLKWLGTRTGPLRDLDVFLLNLSPSLAEGEAQELEPLRAAVRRLRSRALRDVRQALRSKRYAGMMEVWRAFLDRDPSDRRTKRARRPIAEVARDRVCARAARVLKRGRGIGATTPAAKIHRLRLQSKKLRYLLDAFGGVLDDYGMKGARKRLRRLQDALGAFNDADVEIGLLARIGAEMAGRKNVPAATLLAMGRRQAALEAGMQTARGKLAERIEGLAGDRELARICGGGSSK